MADSVDPDQTTSSGAVQSGSTLFAYAILWQIRIHILWHLIWPCTVSWVCLPGTYSMYDPVINDDDSNHMGPKYSDTLTISIHV